MRWAGRRQSENVQDRRGMPVAAVGGGLGIGGILLLMVVSWLFQGDPGIVLDQMPGGVPVAHHGGGGPVDPSEEPFKEFVSVVLADTEDVWNEQFRRLGRRYQEPSLVLFSEQVDSACGSASSAVGPFYCPLDQQVYIDLKFLQDMKRRFGAPGDFAMAYVVAHEVGHHVQRLLGYSDRVDRMRGRVSEQEFNRLSVRLELQADFLAGVWAHHAQRMKDILEQGDLQEAMNAASAVGDDRLQQASRGRIVPDAFTHGTSEQRMRWFRRGFESGDISQADTFAIPYDEL
jgi:predicted metalloprotease